MILAKMLGKKTVYFFHGPVDQEYRAAKGYNTLIIGIPPQTAASNKRRTL